MTGRATDSIAAEIVQNVASLRRFARALSGDPSLADDLVQDTVERALSKLHLYDPSRPLKAWLFAILRNLYVSEVRRVGRGRVVKTVDDMAPAEQAVDGGQESQLGIRSIASALGRLPEANREVILLVALEDMSYRDCAEILGVPVGTVMSRLSRGRVALRDLLEGRDKPSLRRVK
ncbi:MAG: RNA polymerase sigma factor [Rhizobiales bacterium]|nr:RNA polymerase sigma factor [Hyphomicrobiales bacterium]